MKTIRFNYNNVIHNHREIGIILGYFDGVHLGHKKLIELAVKEAKMPLGIITFDKPISSLINNGKYTDVITSLDDRFKIISKLGVDYFYVVEIDNGFLSVTAEGFIEILKEMNVKKVYVGEDFRFGKDRKGDIAELKKHFDTTVVDILNMDGVKIGTQRIDSLIREGKIQEANKQLGHNYMVTGFVERGQGLGSKIGFPTANVHPITNYIMPKLGVYKVIAYIDNVPHLALANVGYHPTVGHVDVPVIEVHLRDFDSEVYGKTISVEFMEFIRPEKKFDDLHELVQQISEDVKKVF